MKDDPHYVCFEYFVERYGTAQKIKDLEYLDIPDGKYQAAPKIASGKCWPKLAACYMEEGAKSGSKVKTEQR